MDHRIKGCQLLEWGRVALWAVCIHIVLLIPVLVAAGVPLREDLFGLSFANDRDGWACGRRGMVLHTTDGGKSWVRQETGTRLTLVAIHMTGPETGWAVGDMGAILHTTDGGAHWEKQESPVPYYLMDVHFVSPYRGWIVTERSHILHTEDGGRAWKIQFRDDDVILKGVSFANPTTGWAVGEYGYIYHTADGGASWQKQAGKVAFDEETMEIIGDPFLFDVAAVDAKRVWAVGIDGHVTRTRDGGLTWETVDVGAARIQLFSVTSDRKKTVLVGGKRSFHVSVDNGEHWKKPAFTPGITYGWIYGIARRGDASFACAGSRGAIYLSNSVDTWVGADY